MGRKRKGNKVFASNCKTGNLFIDPDDDNLYCVSKESPTSKKFDKIPCQTLACPNYVPSLEKDVLPPKELKIRGFIKEGKSKEFIIENVPCGKRYYYYILNKLKAEEKKELQKIEPIKDESIEKDTNSSESSKAEPIKRENPKATNPLGIDQRKYEEKIRGIERESGIGVSYQEIKRQMEEASKSKPSYPFKLNLEGNPYEVIEEAICSISKWSFRNNRELTQYLENGSLPYSLFQHLEPIKRLLWLDEVSRVQPSSYSNSWGYVSIADPTIKRRIFYWTYTFKELFEKLDIPLPDKLNLRAYEIIVDKDQLIESDIFGYLIEKAIKELSIAYLEEQWDQIKGFNHYYNISPEDKMKLVDLKHYFRIGRFEFIKNEEIYRLISEKLKELILI